MHFQIEMYSDPVFWKTVVLTTHNDGPIDYVCEEGDSTPIVLLNGPIGWRHGGGKLIQVYFSGVGGKRIALSFDEPRLREAIMALTQALDGQNDSQNDGHK